MRWGPGLGSIKKRQGSSLLARASCIPVSWAQKMVAVCLVMLELNVVASLHLVEARGAAVRQHQGSDSCHARVE